MVPQAFRDIISKRIIERYKSINHNIFGAKGEFIESMFPDEVYVIPIEYELDNSFMTLVQKRLIYLQFLNGPYAPFPKRTRVFKDTTWDSPEWDEVVDDYIIQSIKGCFSCRRAWGEFWMYCWNGKEYFIRGGEYTKYDLIGWIKQEFPCRTERQIDYIMTCLFPPPYPDPHECIEDRVFCN